MNQKSQYELPLITEILALLTEGEVKKALKILLDTVAVKFRK